MNKTYKIIPMVKILLGFLNSCPNLNKNTGGNMLLSWMADKFSDSDLFKTVLKSSFCVFSKMLICSRHLASMEDVFTFSWHEFFFNGTNTMLLGIHQKLSQISSVDLL